jgi:hypothetical protein
MIQYRFPEEKEFLLHYAKKLGNKKVESIILVGEVKSSDEANALSKFFWEMVDEIVIDKDAGEVVAGQEDLEAWNEYVFESIRAYLRNNGYEKEWDVHV